MGKVIRTIPLEPGGQARTVDDFVAVTGDQAELRLEAAALK
jgi:hypothetical protein